MYQPIHLLQGWRYFLESTKQKIKGPHKYPGTADDICRETVAKCWNGKYFQTSTHHYQEFWARDFGYTIESLQKLGYKQKIHKTLTYALEHYSKTGIKTTISREGIPFSFPTLYSPDSIALTLHSLNMAKAQDLVNQHEQFLQKELDTFANIVLEDGKVRNAQFSGMRDHAIRKSSCYDHCMAILTARTAHKLKLKFPYTEKELVKNLDEYWTGTHYADDIENKTPTADANTIPYWLGIGKHFNKTLKMIQTLQLDLPLPLAYTHAKQKMRLAEILVPNWEQNTHWPFIGLIWIQTVKKHNPTLAKKYKRAYKQVIEKYSTIYEAYTPQGKPYKSLFYHADEGMIWAANYLTL